LILNYRGLSVESIKELDCGLVSRKVRGLIAKCQGKSIINRIIFLKKTLWTESTVWWTGLGVAHRGPAAWTAQSFVGAWPSATPERRSSVHEHGEREGRLGELTRGSPGCRAVGKRSMVTAERSKCWWPVVGRSSEIEGRRRRSCGAERAEGLVALL
jgi:hypothetical protein